MNVSTRWMGWAALIALLLAGSTQAAPVPAAKGQPVDVVICLDVSGSMGGLIDAAKLKLWDIVNDLARAKPTPRLRVALYSYGGSRYAPGAGWVRKEIDLTSDLDAVNQKLNVLRASGSKEYVARVCHDALTQQKWSEEKNTLRVIFVAGNESATQDPKIKLDTVAALAKKTDVIINPIYCGVQRVKGSESWQAFAKMTGGQYNSIDHTNTVVIKTPYDAKLRELSTKFNTTCLAYGKKGEAKKENQAAQDRLARKASPTAAAARAVTKGGKLYAIADWDLVSRLERDPKFDVTKVPVKQLPKEMQKMKPEERVKHLKKLLAKRNEIRKQISELAKKQREYQAKERKKLAGKADKDFDAAVRRTLRKQAATRGLEIPKDK